MPTILTLDMETFYSKDYSLSKMATEAYVNDPKFEVICVAVKQNDEPTQSFSGSKKETAAWLSQFDWEDAWVLAHNCLFDGTILSWKFGIKPKLWLDTLSMARALHGTEVGGSLKALAEYYGVGEKGTEVMNALGKRRVQFQEWEMDAYTDYCRNDVDLTYQIFCMMAQAFEREEIKLIDMTLRMHIEPRILLDTFILKQHLHEVREKKEELMARVTADKSELMSNPMFAEALRVLGVEPPTKISLRTGKETFAFAKSDEGMKALLDHENPDVQALVAARVGVKSTLEETRTQRFIDMGERFGKLPVPLKYYGAMTGRWAATDGTNLQNIPRKSKMKEAMVAPDDWKLVGSDLSNIELRVGLYFAGQMDKLQLLADGVDLYKDFASGVFGVAYDEVDEYQRFIGKQSSLSLIYGTGHKKLRNAIKMMSGKDIGETEAKRIVDFYRKDYAKVVAAWSQGETVLRCIKDNMAYMFGAQMKLEVMGKAGIKLPSGLFLRYPDLNLGVNEEGRKEWTYAQRKERIQIHGPKTYQNCISEGTLVLTHRGWIPIEKVALNDYVHDGEFWVGHGGVVFQSVQSCVRIDGVWMTPDHEVLTNEGWKAASQNPRPYRPDIRNVTCIMSRPQRWKKEALEISMLLRKSFSKGWDEGATGSHKGRNAELRVRNQKANLEKQHQTWDVSPSGLRGMGQYACALLQSATPSLQKLRREGHNGVRTLARILRQLLGRHGDNISTWVRVRQERQQWALLRRELSLGLAAAEHNEPPVHPLYRYTHAVKTIGNRDDYPVQPPEVGMASGAPARQTGFPQQERKVYDILNCGPRTRFVVKGDTGPLIVHNCIQALARCVMGEAMVRVGKKLPVVLTIHDALYCVVPDQLVEKAAKFIVDELKRPPAWAPGLPLDAEVGAGQSLAFKMAKLQEFKV